MTPPPPPLRSYIVQAQDIRTPSFITLKLLEDLLCTWGIKYVSLSYLRALTEIPFIVGWVL